MCKAKARVMSLNCARFVWKVQYCDEGVQYLLISTCVISGGYCEPTSFAFSSSLAERSIQFFLFVPLDCLLAGGVIIQFITPHHFINLCQFL